MKVAIIRMYATVQVVEVESTGVHHIDQALAKNPGPPPVEAGYEVRKGDGQVIQQSGWRSPYRKDLPVESLAEHWYSNQGRDQVR